MALMENWDLKDSNNRILAVKNGGRTELQYIVSDLGTTFGKLGVVADGLYQEYQAAATSLKTTLEMVY